jgi:UDP-N-acetylglucosamine acyltransferase
MAKIHPTAQIGKAVELGDDVSVGPYAVIGEGAVLGDRCVVANHATITGRVRAGTDNIFHPHCVVGGEPQMRGGKLGQPTELVMGNGNTVRECVTLNVGTEKGGGRSVIGDNGLFMACSHVAHDCVIGNNVIMVNNVLLGGHVHVQDGAILSGGAALHHFTTVGMLAFLGGLTRIVQDVPPFMIVEGNPSKVRGVNVVGLRRNGAMEESIDKLKEAYRLLYRSGKILAESLQELSARDDLTAEVKILVNFLQQTEKGKHGRAREALRE